MIEIPRFYEKKIPEIDEHIICSVNQIDDNCIYFHMIEYNIEILVPFKDLNESRGRKAKYKIASKYKKNTNHVFYVTNIEGEIEISNRGINENTIQDFNLKYNNKKFVINIFKDFLNNLKIQNKDEYIEYAKKTIWKIPENKWYVKMIDIKLNNQNINIFDINEKEKEIFVKYVNHSINDIKYFLEIEIQMFSIDIQGIIIIKEILNNMEKICEKMEKDIRLVKAPIYKINLQNNNLDSLKQYISEYKNLEEKIKIDKRIVFECKYKKIMNNLNKDILNFE